jgi:Zn-dependent M28 family amino/carboxypeptidase
VRDDHLPFIKIGVPAAVLMDFDYPYWHTLQDTLDKCSPESLFAVFSVVVDAMGKI